MSTAFARPIRNRLKLVAAEKLAAGGNALSQFRLGAAMVIFNLIVPFNYTTFGVYLLPAILMFAVACLISHAYRTLSPNDPERAQLFAFLLIVIPVFLGLWGHDVRFEQRLLGNWHITNIFARFTFPHFVCLIAAAALIPKDNSWRPLYISEFLIGVCLIGFGVPERELYAHAFYSRYLGLVAVIMTALVTTDIARCSKAWCASSPLTNLEGSNKILGMSIIGSVFEPLFDPLGFAPRCLAATARAELLWFAMWPTPPESLDPRCVELAHSGLLQGQGARRCAASLMYASLFAFALCAFPPAQHAEPYALFAIELVAPIAIQFLVLAVFFGPLLVRAERLSQSFYRSHP